MPNDTKLKFAPNKNPSQRLFSNTKKASEDEPSKTHKLRSKSKNRIPKILRYDLENALIGLCDVWFGEIKPYLVRNNVKLHVHDDTGDAVGGGDRGNVTNKFKCTHIDPGISDHHRQRSVNYADSCSTLPTASKAQCRKQPTSQLARIAVEPTESPMHCHKWTEKRAERKLRKRGKCQQTDSRQPVPRLCRTYIPLLPSQKDIANISQKNCSDRSNRKRISLRNASTQTVEIDYIDYITEKLLNAKRPSSELCRRQDEPKNKTSSKPEKKLQVLFVSPRKNRNSCN